MSFSDNGGFRFITGASLTAQLRDLQLVNLPYEARPQGWLSLLAVSMQAFRTPGISTAETFTGMTSSFQGDEQGQTWLNVLRCTLVVSDPELACLARAAAASSSGQGAPNLTTLLRASDALLPRVRSEPGLGGVHGILMFDFLQIDKLIKYTDVTLVSASRYTAEVEAAAAAATATVDNEGESAGRVSRPLLLPSALEWAPLWLYEEEVALQWGGQGTCVANNISSLVSYIHYCGLNPSQHTVLMISAPVDLSIAPVSMMHDARIDPLDIDYGRSPLAPAEECVVSGLPPAHYGRRTYLDLKGAIHRMQLTSPLTLRDLVLYNLAPGGTYPMPAVSEDGSVELLPDAPQLVGADAAWANSSLPLWYYRCPRSDDDIQWVTEQAAASEGVATGAGANNKAPGSPPPRLVLSNVVLVVPEAEWRALVAALLLQHAPGVLEAAQQRRAVQQQQTQQQAQQQVLKPALQHSPELAPAGLGLEPLPPQEPPQQLQRRHLQQAGADGGSALPSDLPPPPATTPPLPPSPPLQPSGPPLPPSPSPPLPSPPYSLTTRTALLGFASASRLASYNYSAGELVLAEARWYGVYGTNVTILYRLPVDAPSGVKLLPYQELVLPYQELADLNIDVVLDVSPPPSSPPSPALLAEAPDHTTGALTAGSVSAQPPNSAETQPRTPSSPPPAPLQPQPLDPSPPLQPPTVLQQPPQLPLHPEPPQPQPAVRASAPTDAWREPASGRAAGWPPVMPHADLQQSADGRERPAAWLVPVVAAVSAVAGVAALAAAAWLILAAVSARSQRRCLNDGSKLDAASTGASSSDESAMVPHADAKTGAVLVSVAPTTSDDINGMADAAGSPLEPPAEPTRRTPSGTLFAAPALAAPHRGGLVEAGVLAAIAAAAAAARPRITSNAAPPAGGTEGSSRIGLTAYYDELRDSIMRGVDPQQLHGTCLQQQHAGHDGAHAHAGSSHQQPAGGDAGRLARDINSLLAELRDPDLEVHAILGSGSFGVVYGGMWRGLPVAVKTLIVPAVVAEGLGLRGDNKRASHARKHAVLEAAISLSLTHPNVVTTYTYELKPLVQQPAPGPAPDWGSEPELLGGPVAPSVEEADAHKLYIVQELCNGGSLRHALAAGMAGSVIRGTGAHRRLALQLALDVALGMAHVHSCRIIHGDLKPDNVLLMSAARLEDASHAEEAADGMAAAMLMGPGRPGLAAGAGVSEHVTAVIGDAGDGGTGGSSSHGAHSSGGGGGSGDRPGSFDSPLMLTAKIADFGLSLPLEKGATHLSQRFQGTPLYTAPEVFAVGHLSPKADVWSFGLMLLELYHGCNLDALRSLRGAVAVGAMPSEVALGGVPMQRPIQEVLLEELRNSPHRLYVKLAASCLVHEPQQRPMFEEIAAQLRSVQALYDDSSICIM